MPLSTDPDGTDRAPAFPVRDVTRWPTEAEEQMGSKRKVWLESPNNASYLFKYVRQDAVGSVYGDDWAEKLAAELARLLGLPAATVDLGEATPFDMLTRTGGSRETDTFHVVAEPIPDADGRVRTLFLAHGVRHLAGAGERITRLRPGDRLTVPPQPDNVHNARALLIDAHAGGEVGWVPDWMLDLVHRMIEADPDYRLTVEVANGPETPAHLRLLCRLDVAALGPAATPQDPDFDYISVGQPSPIPEPTGGEGS